jgi:DNA-binding transcriptional LysR family regulator
MKLHQIRYFLALCDERSFTRAANKCGVSQPSLTNGIKALEDELGGMLFTRRPNVVLTRFGSAVRPRLMRVAEDIVEVLEIARSLHRKSVASADGASQMSRPLF